MVDPLRMPIEMPPASVVRVAEAGYEGRIDLPGTAALLSEKHALKEELLETAAKINLKQTQGELELYGISYVADLCANDCAYCGLSTSIKFPRSMLSPDELREDLRAVLQNGATDLCILAGEHPRVSPKYLALAGRIALEEHEGCLERLTFNVAPMPPEGFRELRDGIDFPLQYRVFQETYNPATYARVHTKGRKRNMGFRLGAQERALDAGFDHVGLGALLGLNEVNEPRQHFGNDAEILSLVVHAQRIRDVSGRLPLSMSLPRVQPVEGGSFVIANPVDDERYVLYHAILKIALPETKLIVTSRETEEVRDRLRPIIGIEDLAPKPGVGGNIRATHFQNELGDDRTADEQIESIRKKGFSVRLGK